MKIDVFARIYTVVYDFHLSQNNEFPGMYAYASLFCPIGLFEIAIIALVARFSGIVVAENQVVVLVVCAAFCAFGTVRLLFGSATEREAKRKELLRNGWNPRPYWVIVIVGLLTLMFSPVAMFFSGVLRPSG